MRRGCKRTAATVPASRRFTKSRRLQGIVNRAGKDVNVIFSEGYQKDGGADLAERAVAAAKSADVVIYIGGLNHDKGFDCEGADRTDMKLPYGQDELIQKIVAANPKTIVVLEGTMVEMDSWLGQSAGAVAGMVSGHGRRQRAGPRFVRRRESVRQTAGDVSRKNCPTRRRTRLAGAYPGTNGTVTYAEGLLVGYRWFDTKNIEPQFPFGFGLSYTTFEYSNLKLIPAEGTNGIVTAQFEIENTGSVPARKWRSFMFIRKIPSVARRKRN